MAHDALYRAPAHPDARLAVAEAATRLDQTGAVAATFRRGRWLDVARPEGSRGVGWRIALGVVGAGAVAALAFATGYAILFGLLVVVGALTALWVGRATSNSRLRFSRRGVVGSDVDGVRVKVAKRALARIEVERGFSPDGKHGRLRLVPRRAGAREVVVVDLGSEPSLVQLARLKVLGAALAGWLAVDLCVREDQGTALTLAQADAAEVTGTELPSPVQVEKGTLIGATAAEGAVHGGLEVFVLVLEALAWIAC